MPNIATVLKEEMTRLARKEIRKETASLQKSSAQYRHDIASLKRQVKDLERKVALLERKVLGTPPKAEATQGTGEEANVRFTAKGLRSQRERLGLSAADYAKLASVSPQTIYNWENEKSSPRKEQVVTLAALRGIGKREAQARLALMGR